MSGFQVLLDAPDRPASEIQCAALGDFSDGRYGDFSITRDDVDQWRKNLEHLPGQRALIDLDHRSDRKPRNTEAAGWITDVRLDGDTPKAVVEWTPVGKDAIKDRRYLFFSPTYGPHRTEDGSVHENTLIGGALTNRPFLSQMPAITLASDDTVDRALTELESENDARLLDVLSAKATNDLPDSAFAYIEPGGDKDSDGKTVPRSKRHFPIHDAAHIRNALSRAPQSPFGDKAMSKIKAAAKKAGIGAPAQSDSPRAMDAPALLEALGLSDDEQLSTALSELELPEDAQAKILDAATELKAKAEKPEPPDAPKTLDQLLQEEGKVALDGEHLRKLEQQAVAGAAASEQLHEQRFELAFDAAVDARKAVPAERDGLHRFFELDADAAIKSLEDRQPIMPEKPAGDPIIDLDTPTDPEQAARAGLHPSSHEIHRQVQAKLKALEKPQSEYLKVLEQMFSDGEFK